MGLVVLTGFLAAVAVNATLWRLLCLPQGWAQVLCPIGKLSICSYPVLAAAFGAVYGLQQEQAGWPALTAQLALLAFLLLLAMIDYRTRTIPNKILLGMLALWVVLAIAVWLVEPLHFAGFLFLSVAGFLFSGAIFLVAYYASKKQVGGGDVKLAAIMGLYLTGERIFGALLYGLLLSALCGIALMLLKKMGKKDAMPFAPFLAIGALLAMLTM